MKRLLNTTTALSLALVNIQPWPLMAQTLTETGSVVAADGSVLCEPTAEAPCDPEAFVEQAAAIAAAMAVATEADAAAAAAAIAEAEAKAVSDAAAAAEAEAKATADAAAAAEAEAKAAADAAAEAEAKAAADTAAAEAEAKAAADAAAAAESDAKAAADAAAAEAEAKAAADAAVEAEAKAAADAAAAVEAQAKAAADAAAEAELKAAADSAAAVEAQAKAAADTAAADAEAKAAADAVDAEAKAAAEAVDAEAKAAADAAAADADAKAAADAAAADADAKAAADAAAADSEAKAAADAAAVDAEAKAAADAAAADAEAKTAADAAAVEAEAKAAADAAAVEAEAKAAADAAAVEAEAKAAEPVTETVTEPAPVEVEPVVVEEAAPAEVVPEKTPEEIAATEAEALEAAQQEIVVNTDGSVVDPAAGLKTEEVFIDPNAEPIEAPVVTEAEADTLTDLLSQPAAGEPVKIGAAANIAPAPTEGEPTAVVPVTEAPASPDAVTSVIEVLTEKDTRSSAQEFTAAPVVVAPGKKNRLSDLEKVGLVAIGALVVGAIIKGANDREDRQVVSNTGDRVVVLNPDGTYSVYKDDDAVLRRPGSTVRTETFRDGSTRTIVERTDGTQVVTIRDATGRVLRRATYDKLGRELVLIDDLADETPVIITQLPRPKKDRVTISTKDENAALKAKLAAREAAKAGRTFSLRQIRDIPEVRDLAATMDVDSVTFNSGSAAITATEADALADLGGLMQDLLDANPGEVFLIEGHTDATGKAAMNLALSDRRAESVALALTEYFDIPPENMVVQGYGESELLIDTLNDERRNRRVAVRVITPLLRTAE